METEQHTPECKWIIEQIIEKLEILDILIIEKKSFEENEDINKAYQNLWDTVKAVLRGLCITSVPKPTSRKEKGTR